MLERTGTERSGRSVPEWLSRRTLHRLVSDALRLFRNVPWHSLWIWVERFTGLVENYQKYREGYPAEEILKCLRQWCDLTSAWKIADVGAGTGMRSEYITRAP